MRSCYYYNYVCAIILVCFSITNAFSESNDDVIKDRITDMDCAVFKDEYAKAKCEQMKAVTTYFHQLNLKQYFPNGYDKTALEVLECVNLMNMNKTECIAKHRKRKVEYNFYDESLLTWDTGTFSDEFRVAAKKCGTPHLVQFKMTNHRIWFIVCYESNGPDMGYIYEYYLPGIYKGIYSWKE